MTDAQFRRTHALEAIRLTQANGLDWLYANYPKPNGQMRRSSTGFLMHNGESYPVKPLGRLASELAGNPIDNNPNTDIFRKQFSSIGFQLIDSAESESEIATERQRRLAKIWERPGQGRFRRAVFALFGARCIVSGCQTLEVLEAAHILPVGRGGGDAGWNGIPLRADLHRLFDSDVLKIRPNSLTLMVGEAQRSDYGQYHGLDLGPTIFGKIESGKIIAAIRARNSKD